MIDQFQGDVMYETGIAHTLGKQVIPITQSIDHVPFDLHHPRAQTYHPNLQGLEKLTSDLSARLRHLKIQLSTIATRPATSP